MVPTNGDQTNAQLLPPFNSKQTFILRSRLEPETPEVQAHVMNSVFWHDAVWTGIYRVSQEECARLREGVPYVKVYRHNPKHLSPKLNGYGDNGQRSLKL